MEVVSELEISIWEIENKNNFDGWVTTYGKEFDTIVFTMGSGKNQEIVKVFYRIPRFK